MFMNHELITTLKENGYRIFQGDGYYNILTPAGNGLSVCNKSFHPMESPAFGHAIGFEYIPSREYGSGCRCGIYADLSLETIQVAEQDGLRFARQLQAPFYPPFDKRLIKRLKEFAVEL